MLVFLSELVAAGDYQKFKNQHFYLFHVLLVSLEVVCAQTLISVMN